MYIILIVILILLCLGGLPEVGPWPHQYGYYPSGIIGVILVVLLILLLLGRL